MHLRKRLWKFWRDQTTAWPFVPDLAHRAPGTHVVSGAWELILKNSSVITLQSDVEFYIYDAEVKSGN